MVNEITEELFLLKTSRMSTTINCQKEPTLIPNYVFQLPWSSGYNDCFCSMRTWVQTQLYQNVLSLIKYQLVRKGTNL